MKKLLITFCVVALSANISFSQSNKVLGHWLTAEDKSQVEIYKGTDGKFYGKVTWLKEEPDKKDVNNPDEKLRDKPVNGLVILKGFSYDSEEKQWVGGTIYDPNNGKTYDCYMWFEDNPNQLIIKGYVLGMRFLGRETEWRKDSGPR